MRRDRRREPFTICHLPGVVTSIHVQAQSASHGAGEDEETTHTKTHIQREREKCGIWGGFCSITPLSAGVRGGSCRHFFVCSSYIIMGT